MSLDLLKLEKVCVHAEKTIARCPACAETGGDSKGKHLVVWADGRYGCAANPKDKKHRSRIWALIGEKKKAGQFTIRHRPKSAPIVIRSIKSEIWDAWDGYFKPQFVSTAISGTLGTGIFESVSDKNRDCLDEEITLPLNQTLNKVSQASQTDENRVFSKNGILPGAWCTVCWLHRGRAIPLKQGHCFLCHERGSL